MKNQKTKTLSLLILGSLIAAIYYINIIRLNEHKPLETPTISKISTPNSLYRLSTNVQNTQMLETYKKYAREYDIVELRSVDVDKLSEFGKAQSILIFGKDENKEAVFKVVKKYNIPILGYNLEDPALTLQQLIEKETVMYKQAKENGLRLAFAPLARQVEQYPAELAINTDIIIIQLRNYQLMSDFKTKVEKIVSQIRKSNPEAEVWGQFDVNPRIPGTNGEKQPITSSELIKEMDQLADSLDVMAIFYPPYDASVAMNVVETLRK